MPISSVHGSFARSAGRTCVGGGVWLGALTGKGLTGRKVSTQRKYAYVFAGSDVQGKCKRITLTLSSVLTYQCMYVGLCILHGRRQRGPGATAPPPSLGGGPRPVAYILTSNLATHFKIGSFAYVYVYPVIFTGCS